MPFGWPDTFTPNPISVSWKQDAEKKRLFGLALAKNPKNAFEAAVMIFPQDSSAALWASTYWLNDETVIAAKAGFSEKIEVADSLLDKSQLCHKLLAFADEKVQVNGNILFAAEAKDRLAALKLFAEIQGFIGKVDLNQTNNYVNNAMKIVLVEAKQEEKVVEHQVEQFDLPALPIKLKLVG